MNTAESPTNDFNILGQVTTRYTATVDQSCVGWRTAVGSDAKGWREGARTNDPAARAIIQPIGPGEGVHISILAKGQITVVPGVAPSPTPAPVPAPAPEPQPNPTQRPFAASSPYNVVVPAAPVLDPHSAQLVALLGTASPVANIYEYGTPVYDEVDAATPRKAVTVVNPYGEAGGLPSGSLVPIPAKLKPSAGADASCVIEDWPNGVGYDFWRLGWDGAKWVAQFATKFSLTDAGTPGHGSTGSDIPLLACLTRASELASGAIEHALSFACPHTAQERTAGCSRYPAFKSDGHSGLVYPNGIPEGTKFWLPRSVDVNALAITTPEKTVCRAIQEHGIIVRNTAGALSIGFESSGSPAEASSPYHAVGWTADYPKIRVPLDKLVALAKWDGA